jgi:hypothetical protein
VLVGSENQNVFAAMSQKMSEHTHKEDDTDERIRGAQKQLAAIGQ